MAETSQKVTRNRDDERDKKKKSNVKYTPAPTTANVGPYQLPFTQTNQWPNRNIEYNNRPSERAQQNQWNSGHNNHPSKPLLCGGTREIDVNHPKVQEYVALALREYNKRSLYKEKLELVKVKKAFFTLVAGMLYLFAFDAKVIVDGEEIKTQTYHSEVFRKISDEVEVTLFKLARDEHGNKKEVVFWECENRSVSVADPESGWIDNEAPSTTSSKTPSSTLVESSISYKQSPLHVPPHEVSFRKPKKSSSFKKYVAQNSRRQARVDKSMDMIIHHLQSQARGQPLSPEFMSYSHEVTASDDEEIVLSDD